MELNKLLVTTAIEETWDDQREIIFLGEWCKRYTQKHKWLPLNSVTMKHHWADREKLYSDYLYVTDFYEIVLENLVQKMNIIHNVEYSNRYWRILVGPWLAYFIHILLDRWHSVRNIEKNLQKYDTIILNGIEDQLIPNDMEQFSTFFKSDIWNHLIYSKIIKFGCVGTIYQKNNQDIRNYIQKDIKVKRKTLIRQFLNPLKFIYRNQDFFVYRSYLNRAQEAFLNIKLGQFPNVFHYTQPNQIDLQWDFRKWAIDDIGRNEFEKFVLSLIPRQMPKSYLEGYKSINNQVDNLDWPIKPKTIYTSNALWYETIAMAYVSKCIENGTKLISAQHGGVYGIAKFTFSEDHEVSISDKYLTWGWADEKRKNIVPFFNLKINTVPKINHNNNKTLLVIILDAHNYSFRLDSDTGINIEKYFFGCFNFFDYIEGDFQKNILVRLPPQKASFDVKNRLRDKFCNINIDDGKKSILNLMKSSRIIVLTYNGTSVLESLSLGIPTVLFFDRKETPLRESAVNYYEKLKRVGILHDTPISAAKHINNIWNDVNSWWLSDQVQLVVSEFKMNYCNTSSHLIAELATIMKATIDESSQY